MTYTDESQENSFKESSDLFPEDFDSWFQDLPHLGIIHPYGMKTAMLKAKLLDGADLSSPTLSVSDGEEDKNGGVTDG